MEHQPPAKLENFKPLFQKYVYEALEIDKLVSEAYYGNKNENSADTTEIKPS